MTELGELRGTDLVLLVGAAGKIPNRIVLHNIVYRLQEHYHLSTYKFYAVDHGPYDMQLQDDFNWMVAAAIIERKDDDDSSCYELTAVGNQEAEQLMKSLDASLLEELSQKIKLWTDQVIEELPTAVPQ